MPVGRDLKYIGFSVVPPQRCQLLEISNLETFFQTSIPPPDGVDKCAPPPPENFPFNLDPYSPPSLSNFVGKTWIYLSGTLIG